MRTAWLVVAVFACGKKQEQPAPPTGSGSAAVVSIDAAAEAPPIDAAAAAVVPVDAAAPAAPTTTTGVEIVSFDGFKVDKLPNIEKLWISWIESHFTKCETTEKVEPATTKVTINFKSDGITFDMPKVPDPIAACIKKNIETPYLGYKPEPPAGLGKTLKVNIKIAEKGPPPAPDTSPVKHVGSKITGARDKREVDKWVDADVARKIKPCIEDSPLVVDLWKVGFEIDASGAIGKVTAPADANVAACAQKALAGITAPKAKGTNAVELTFTRPN